MMGATMGNRLDGKVAMITGAARGQGEAAARLFIDEGASVVLCDILDERGEQLASELGERARYASLDVSEETQWASALEMARSAFGEVSVLINNAGIVDFGPLVDTTLERYLRVIKVNQLGAFLGMRTVAPSMERNGSGSIINVSSMNGLVGYPGTIAYTASKSALRGMTKAAAMELGPQGIRVNSVHPGAVDTEMIRPANSDDLPTDEEQLAMYAAYPLRRPAQAEEIARLALFLASDAASYSTGSEFLIDGGMLAGPLIH